MLNDHEKNNEILHEMLALLSKFDGMHGKLMILRKLILNMVFQSHAGNLIYPTQQEFVVNLFNLFLEETKADIKDIFLLSEKEFISQIYEKRKSNPKYGDLFDETLSSYNELKKKFKKG